jgi:hypothetical protein
MSLSAEILKDYVVWKKLKALLKTNPNKRLKALERGYAKLFKKIGGLK